jgi:hypothetical protein
MHRHDGGAPESTSVGSRGGSWAVLTAEAERELAFLAQVIGMDSSRLNIIRALFSRVVRSVDCAATP